MLKKFKRLFDAPQPQVTEEDMHLAGAVLLMEIAMADHAYSDREERLLLGLLQSQFKLSIDEVQKLQQLARESVAREVSLHHHLDVINANFDAAQKIQLMRAMWDMAFADGELHHYEEHLIRRLGDLLYVPHRDFIRTKHNAARDSE